MTEEREGQGMPQVRVMSDQERESYDGVTIEQGVDGEMYERATPRRSTYRASSGDDGGPWEHATGGPDVTFERMDAKGLCNVVLEHLLGRRWKWKLVGIGAVVVVAIAAILLVASSLLVFLAPALLALVVIGGLSSLLMRGWH